MMINSDQPTAVVVPTPQKDTKPYSLRLAEHKDAAAIAKLGAHVWITTFAYSISQADCDHYIESAYSTEAIERDIANPNVEIIVVTNTNNEIIAFSQLRRDSVEPCLANTSKPTELQRLYVSLDYFGQGIAKLLMQDAEERAIAQGFEHLWLGVWEENYKAQKVYQKFGFERVGEHGFVMGDCTQTDWIMVKPLRRAQ